MTKQSVKLSHTRPCPLCNSEDVSEINRYVNFQFFSDAQEQQQKRVDVATVRCGMCAALFMNPTYTREGFQVLFAEAGQSYGSAPSRQDEIVEWIGSRIDLHAELSACDIGCYEGGLLRRMPATVNRIGVDIDALAIQRARQNDRGGSYVLGDLHDFTLSSAPDLFTMFHVLEHVERPVDLLRNLRSQAHSRTLLVLEVPILELVETEDEDVCGFFSVQHLTHFSRATLRAAVEKSGWIVREWVEQPDYNGCRILCSRSEVAVETVAYEPTRALSIDIELLYRVLADWTEHLSNHAQTLSALEGVDHVVIWGAGMHTETLQARYSLLNSLGVKRWTLVDSDPNKQGTYWRGIRVDHPETLREIDWSTTRLLVSTYGSQDVVVRRATQMGVPEEAITQLYKNLRRY